RSPPLAISPTVVPPLPISTGISLRNRPYNDPYTMHLHDEPETTYRR
ncbi:hypothetical protein LINPERHAP1_LOCUS1700, partial [Linum perenne]